MLVPLIGARLRHRDIIGRLAQHSFRHPWSRHQNRA